MSLNSLSQIFIILFGCSAIWLVGRTEKWKRWGYIAGLLGQPFWFYTTITNEQWGIVALSCWYTYSWAQGVWNYWLFPEEDNSEIQIDFRIKNDPYIPAFAAYVVNSVKEEKVEILLNVEGSLIASAEHDIDFHELISENTLHEILHAFQELFERTFDEEEVEQAIFELREYRNKTQEQ